MQRSATSSQSDSFQSDHLRGISLSIASASVPVGWRSRKMPSSLIMKKWVAWALSALLPVRAMMLRNGVPSSGLPLGFTSGPSCVVTPVMPVMQVMSRASSSGVNGAGSLVLSWLSAPAVTEWPLGIRRVRRSVSADMSGYENRSRRGSWPSCGSPADEVSGDGGACSVMTLPRVLVSCACRALR